MALQPRQQMSDCQRDRSFMQHVGKHEQHVHAFQCLRVTTARTHVLGHAVPSTVFVVAVSVPPCQRSGPGYFSSNMCFSTQHHVAVCPGMNLIMLHLLSARASLRLPPDTQDLLHEHGPDSAVGRRWLQGRRDPHALTTHTCVPAVFTSTEHHRLHKRTLKLRFLRPCSSFIGKYVATDDVAAMRMGSTPCLRCLIIL